MNGQDDAAVNCIHWIGKTIGHPYTPPRHFRPLTIIMTAEVMSQRGLFIEHAELEAERNCQPSFIWFIHPDGNITRA